MSNLTKYIDRLTQFGIYPNVESEDKVSELKRLLIGIYYEYAESVHRFDENEYDDEPEFDYASIRHNISQNFPDFGWYQCISDTSASKAVAELITSDALDDLTDIIKDMLAVKWRFENTSVDDAIWHFELSMQSHSEQHLIDFLRYLKDKKG